MKPVEASPGSPSRRRSSVGLGGEPERLVFEEDLLEAIVHLVQPLLRPRDPLLDQAGFFAQPLLAYASVVFDLAGRFARFVLDRLRPAAGVGERALDLLIGLK